MESARGSVPTRKPLDDSNFKYERGATLMFCRGTSCMRFSSPAQGKDHVGIEPRFVSSLAEPLTARNDSRSRTSGGSAC